MLKMAILMMLWGTCLYATEFQPIFTTKNFIEDITKFQDEYLVSGAGSTFLVCKSDIEFSQFLSGSDTTNIALPIKIANDEAYIMVTEFLNNNSTLYKYSKNGGFKKSLIFSVPQHIYAYFLPVDSSIIISVLDKYNNQEKIQRLEADTLADSKIIGKSTNYLPFSFARLSENEIIAGGSGNTSCLYYSDDKGKTFVEKKIGIPMLSQVSAYDGTIYVMNAYGKLLKSTDKGDSWITIMDIPNGNRYGSFQVVNHDSIYACTTIDGKKGLLVETTDGGANWKYIYHSNDYFFTCLYVDGKKILLGTYDGYLLSNNNITSVQEWDIISLKSNKVCPNPCSDNFSLSIEEDIKDFKIYDLEGRDVSNLVKMQDKHFDTSLLQNGTYCLIINNVSTKFIVQKNRFF